MLSIRHLPWATSIHLVKHDHSIDAAKVYPTPAPPETQGRRKRTIQIGPGDDVLRGPGAEEEVSNGTIRQAGWLTLR